MRVFRTVLEQKIHERRQTLAEFTEYANSFARQHGEPGTLSMRHLQRLVAGVGPGGRPLGTPQAATARLLERIFGVTVDQLLGEPEPALSGATALSGPESAPVQKPSEQQGITPSLLRDSADFTASLSWLDERAGWIPDTSQRRLRARVSKLDSSELRDRHTRRARVTRSQLACALEAYYRPSGQLFRASVAGRELTTSVVSQLDWLDLACPLGPRHERFTLDTTESTVTGDLDAQEALNRLAEATALQARFTNTPLYRLLDIEPSSEGLRGTVSRVPFAEYALTMDLLEAELIDALAARKAPRPGELPLRDRYLPDLESVFDLRGRLCAGGPLALCAIARPEDSFRGEADFALLVQERSSQVLNARQRLAVIPKSFHHPLWDPRSETRIGATLHREMEQELFGRSEVDTTAAEHRAAEPMHPARLSEPMRWLRDDPARLRMECTGFGYNLVSGNYEFASLAVIEDEEFWTRFGGDIEANWEAAGLRLYSSRDPELLTELIGDEKWTNEGLFALLLGLRRLAERRDSRVRLPEVRHSAATASAR